MSCSDLQARKTARIIGMVSFVAIDMNLEVAIWTHLMKLYEVYSKCQEEITYGTVRSTY